MKPKTTNFFRQSADSVRFTFEYRKRKYVVYSSCNENRSYLQLAEIVWDLWNGTRILHNVEDARCENLARLIADHAGRLPDRTGLRGEHYSVTDTVMNGQSAYQLTYKRKLHILNPVLSRGSSSAAMILFSFAFAVLITYLYTYGSNISWAAALFRSLNRKQLVILVLVIELSVALIPVFHEGCRKFFNIIILITIPIHTITLIAVAKLYPVYGIIIWTLIAIASAVFLLPGIIDALKETGARWKRRGIIKKSLSDLCLPLAIGVTCCAVVVNLLGLSGYTYKSDLEDYGRDSEYEIMSAYFQTALHNINANKWHTLDETEKLDTLQIIADYECVYHLGCDTTTVQLGYPGSCSVLGSYSNVRNVITIDTDHLNTNSVDEVLITLLHEVRHAWQYSVVKMFNDIEPELDEEYLSLEFYRDAYNFRSNFELYESASMGEYSDYYYQDIEIDSREWAEYTKINEYDRYIYIDSITDGEETIAQ